MNKIEARRQAQEIAAPTEEELALYDLMPKAPLPELPDLGGTYSPKRSLGIDLPEGVEWKSGIQYRDDDLRVRIGKKAAELELYKLPEVIQALKIKAAYDGNISAELGMHAGRNGRLNLRGATDGSLGLQFEKGF